MFLKLEFAQIATEPRNQPSKIYLPSVSKCCGYLSNSIPLMKCVNDSSNENMNFVFKDQLKSPSIGVGIVTYATKDIWDYTAYSLAVNEAYAEANGYIMRHLDPGNSNFEPKDARWNKVKILEEAIHPDRGWARDLDYVVWVDADLIFLDMSMRLEQVAAEYPQAHILISAEHAGSSTLVNSGTVMIKNSNWARTFLSDWWTFADRRLHSDQEQFDMLYEAQKVPKKLEKYVAILPPDALNSDPPAMTKQKPHNQVLHLMGEHTAFRVRAFGAAFQNICNATTALPNSRLSPQLGVTREALLAWTLEVYSEEANRLFSAFVEGVDAGLNGLREARKLSNSIHHLAHALENQNNEKDMQLASSLRIQTYDILLRNLEQKRVENERHRETTGRVLEDWPEMMKNVAEAGQNIIQTGGIERRWQVAGKVMSLLNEMHEICHPVQRKAVALMIAHMYIEQGLLSLTEEKVDNAVTNFQTSLKISKELAAVSGDHILVNPLSMLANTLSMLKRFEESYPMFETAIEISERHLGLHHESLIQLLVNDGIARVQGGQYKVAKEKLERALYIMKVNDFPQSSVLFQRAKEYLNKAMQQ